MFVCQAFFLSPRPGDIGVGGRVCPSLVPPDRSLPRLLRPIFRLFPAQNSATHEDPHLRRTARPAQRHSRSIFILDGDLHKTRDIEVLWLVDIYSRDAKTPMKVLFFSYFVFFRCFLGSDHGRRRSPLYWPSDPSGFASGPSS